MKKTLLMAVAAAALTLAAGQAQASDYAPAAESGGWYVSIFGGVAFQEDMTGSYFGSSNYSIDLDTGYLVGVAVGSTLWSDNVRGEIEFSYTNQDVNQITDETSNGDSFEAKGDVDQFFILANLWYDWHTDTGFTPYVGGGLGVGWIDPNIDEVDGSDDFFDFSKGQAALAGQLGVGVKWDLSDSLALDLGYRLKAIINSDLSMEGDDDNDNLVGTDSYTHAVQLGVTLGF